ncbi:MAG: hypothetical protein AAF438_20090 [Pseudomonadota bacterium]
MQDDNIQTPSRWQLFRDIIVFQVKLVIDGLRDALLIPTSLLAGLFGVLTKPSEPGHYFYRVVRMGRQSEKWINLFGMAPPDDPKSSTMDVRPLDSLIKDLESSVVDQYNRGGVTAKAKDAIDSALDAIARLRENQQETSDSSDSENTATKQ